MRFAVLIVPLLFFPLASCVPPLYIPNSFNAPLLTSKNELSFSASFGDPGFDFHGAYSLTENFAVTAGASFDDYGEENRDEDRHRHFYFESSAGFFGKPVGGYFVLEGFAGLGGGTAKSMGRYYDKEDDLGDVIGRSRDTAEGDYFRVFFQLECGIVFRFFEAGLGVRPAYVNFYNYSYETFTEYNEDGSFSFDSRDEPFESNYYIEPFVFIRGGIKNIKVQIQYGKSYSIKDNPSFGNQERIFSLGLVSRFGI